MMDLLDKVAVGALLTRADKVGIAALDDDDIRDLCRLIESDRNCGGDEKLSRRYGWDLAMRILAEVNEHRARVRRGEELHRLWTKQKMGEPG
jgi:hypothetical protein